MKKSFIHLPALAMFAWVGLLTATSPGLTVPFTETFNTDASNWLNGASATPDWYATDGVGNSGYISFTSTFTSEGPGSWPDDITAPPLATLFRGNATNSASGGAFVGDWISGGVITLTLSVRHDYTEALNFYARLAGTSGRAAILAFDSQFEVQPDTWTPITIQIVDNNPPFVSYSAGTFANTFGDIWILQFGLYLPEYTTFTDLKFDIDNVSIVPEPTTAMFLVVAALGMLFVALRRRPAAVSEKAVSRISRG